MNEPRFDTLPQWLEWLETAHPEHEIELGLDRVKRVATDMELLSPALFVITVAGTNGKGSTVALLESILLAAGHKVGVFTSPHFIHFNERVHINGDMIGDQPLCSAFSAIDQGRGSTWLTYFEFCTLAALHCFKQQPLDYVILEVGLGGRLDATNIVDSDVAVITTIGLDHQDWLGYSLEAIGTEKAGIMRSGQPIIYGALEMPASIQKRAIDLEAPLYRLGHEFGGELRGDTWFWFGVSNLGCQVEANGLPVPVLELDNAMTALQVLQFLPESVEQQAIVAGLESASLPGRAQKLKWVNEAGHSIDVMLDVSHNPQAVKRLAANLAKNVLTGKTRAVMAIANDKDHVSILDLLASQIDHWVITEFDSPRALSVTVLNKALERVASSVTVASSVIDAFHQAVNASAPGDRVLVTGSFMTVADILALAKQS